MNKLLEIINKTGNRKNRIRVKFSIILVLYVLTPLILEIVGFTIKNIPLIMLSFVLFHESFRIGSISFSRTMHKKGITYMKEESPFYDTETALNVFLLRFPTIFVLIMLFAIIASGDCIYNTATLARLYSYSD